MCPDVSLLSALADGEVPSPWKERIEAHARNCPDCAAKLESYRGLRAALRSAGPGCGEIALDAAKARIASRLDLGARLPVIVPGRVGARVQAAAGTAIWSRRVTLPIPLAAAAVAAFIFVAGLATGIFSLRSDDSRMVAAVQKVLSTQPNSLEGVVKYLDSRESSQTMTITLPSETSFQQPGDPIIMTVSSGGHTTDTVDGGAP